MKKLSFKREQSHLIDELTIERRLLIGMTTVSWSPKFDEKVEFERHSKSFTLDKKVEIEQYISRWTDIHNVMVGRRCDVQFIYDFSTL